jgi:hypothetical protein
MEAVPTFVHVPKTAGTTLRAVIKSRHPTVVRFRDDADFQAWRDHRTDGRDAPAYMGHMPYGIHEVTGRPHAYLTMVREPTARIASSYHYLRRRGDLDGPADRPLPLIDWLDGRGANTMTWQLAGGSSLDPATGRCDRVLLDRALAHTEGFVAIGVQEHFDESLALLCHRFGWGYPRFRPRNVADTYPELSREERAHIEHHTELDRELYQRLSGRVERDLRAMRTRVVVLGLRNHPAVHRAEDVLRTQVRRARPRPGHAR